jgi:hypothetical protein
MEREIQILGEHDQAETNFHRLKYTYQILPEHRQISYQILHCVIEKRQEEDNKLNPPKNLPHL